MWLLDDFPKAEEMLERSIPMFEHLGATSQGQLACAMLLAVLGFDPNIDPVRQIHHARALLASGGPDLSPLLAAGAYDSLGSAYRYLGDYGTACACYLRSGSGKSRESARRITERRRHAVRYSGAGDSCQIPDIGGASGAQQRRIRVYQG